MDLSPLPEPLRTKVAKKLTRKPQLEGIVNRLMMKRAASPHEQHSVDALLADLVKPNVWLFVSLSLGIGLPALALGAMFYGEHQTQQALANGTSTTARVELMKPGNCLLGSKSTRCLTLKLKVFPSGSAAYDAELTESVSLEWLPRVQPGSWLVVAVDKSDPQTLTLDEVAFQRPPPPPIE